MSMYTSSILSMSINSFFAVILNYYFKISLHDLIKKMYDYNLYHHTSIIVMCFIVGVGMLNIYHVNAIKLCLDDRLGFEFM